jgi:uncharacterized protein YukE
MSPSRAASGGANLGPTDRDTTRRPAGPAPAATIRVDDPSRFTDAAGAFRQALEALTGARSRFTGRAHGLGHDLGDPGLVFRYDEAYRQALRTLDAVEHCFEEFVRALSSTRTEYEATDTSVAGRMR